MPAGLDMTWRGVRPLLPGAVGRLAASTTATVTAATPATLPTTRRHTLMRPLPCALCRPRRTRTVAARPLFYYSTTSKGSSTPASADTGDKDRDQPATVSYQTMAKDLEAKRRRDLEDRLRQHQHQQQSASSSSTAASKITPGTVLIDFLDREPSLPMPPPPAAANNTTAATATRRPMATSALTKPIRHHLPPSEIDRSRKQHVKSVVRQGRLEILRQMQDLEMVDWRQILRRLALSTPPEHAYERVSVAAAQRTVMEDERDDNAPAKMVGWRAHAVLLSLPADSPAVTELVHGIDDSMWSIWSRTGCELKLFRWQGLPPQSVSVAAGMGRASGDYNFTDRPWLLSISGSSDMSISRAVTDVLRFSKDAEAIALGPSDLGLLDDMWAVGGEDSTTAADASKQTQTKGPWRLEASSSFTESRYVEDPVFRPYVADMGAHEIPRPDVWTPDSFERYVAALVNATPPPQLASRIYHEQIARDAAESGAEAEAEVKAEAGAETKADLETKAKAEKSRWQPNAPSHSLAVIALLHDAFHDDTARSAVSLSAFKMALAYMCRFGEARRSDVRALFARVEALRIPMDTETFNILLASYVKSQDVRNYGATLRVMLGYQHGYTPDLTTWLLFLRLFWSDEVKRHILHTMSARGLLNTSRAVRLVAIEMAEHDAEQAVLRVGNKEKNSSEMMPDFLAAQTQRYGPRWLSRVAANRILDVLASHARFADCDALLAALQAKQDADTYRPRRPKSAMKLARARQRRPRGAANADKLLHPPPGYTSSLSLDTVTYNIVLTHCEVQNDLAAALGVLRRMEVAGAPRVPENDNLTSYMPGRPWLPRIPPDSATYHLLFALAWAQRLPHTMAVIWHYACTTEQTRHWILLRASRELVERDDGRPPMPLAYYLTGIDPEDERAKLSLGDVPRSVSGHAPLHTAGLAMSTRIAKMYEGLEPEEPLSKVLEQAMALDAAMRESPEPAASQPRMKIRMRKQRLKKRDKEFVRGGTIFSFMEIPVKWGEFKTIEYIEYTR